MRGPEDELRRSAYLDDSTSCSRVKKRRLNFFRIVSCSFFVDHPSTNLRSIARSMRGPEDELRRSAYLDDSTSCSRVKKCRLNFFRVVSCSLFVDVHSTNLRSITRSWRGPEDELRRTTYSGRLDGQLSSSSRPNGVLPHGPFSFREISRTVVISCRGHARAHMQCQAARVYRCTLRDGVASRACRGSTSSIKSQPPKGSVDRVISRHSLLCLFELQQSTSAVTFKLCSLSIKVQCSLFDSSFHAGIQYAAVQRNTT
ncbi:unnamed protein product, partial [Trichogramma brassicae]